MQGNKLVHNFAQIPWTEIPRSSFSRSHTQKTTMYAGGLYPIYVDDMVPSDTFSVDLTVFGRMSNATIVPFMDNLYFDIQCFIVPYRLVWDNFKKFMGERRSPGDSVDYLIPQVVAGSNGFGADSLYDHMGVYPFAASLSVSALFGRAYILTWNEWYRDENLQDWHNLSFGDGPDNVEDYVILPRGKRHDYFTSSLPWPQKGDSVMIPGSDMVVAPVVGNGQTPQVISGSGAVYNLNLASVNAGDAKNNRLVLRAGDATGTGQPNTTMTFAEQTGLSAEIQGVPLVSVNVLRQGFAAQRLLEKDARGGTRYTEVIRTHFGTVSPDARQQRPEYVGGGTIMMNVSPIAQTSATDSTSPQGNLVAQVTLANSKVSFTKSVTEHSILLCLASIRADLTYQQGTNRMFFRKNRLDFYWPTLSHIGEQSVKLQEIYTQAPSVMSPDGETPYNDYVFGYQEAWAEYRYYPSLITGKMRSKTQGAPNDYLSLDVWHLAQKFNNVPALNSEFIEENPPLQRVMSVTEEPPFIVDIVARVKAVRPMPVYSVPGLMDHF